MIPSSVPSNVPSSYSFPPVIDIDIAEWLRTMPSSSPSGEDDDSLSKFHGHKIKATYTFPYTFVNEEFTEEQLKQLENVLQLFLNQEWPEDDVRGTLIIDVHAVPNGVDDTSRMRRLRRRAQDVITFSSLDLVITGFTRSENTDTYDFVGIISTIFKENKIDLWNDLNAIDLPFIVPVVSND
jgi:hypothetical protein